MGIPRLTQDLQPYLESMSICGESPSDASVHVQKVIIDGPSMVYHVYNRLLLNSDGFATNSICNQPAYAQLNASIACFLHTFESCGAEIYAIYFDGALPAEKRSIRLDRLEKTRRSLEAFRLTHPSIDVSISSLDFNKPEAIWSSGARTVSTSGAIPAPFIVPAAVEYLTDSKWAAITYVVPDEADVFCAASANIHKAAVITNDSDLVLYEDMLEGSVVVPFNSLRLETVARSSQGNSQIILGNCWRPAHISKQLGLPSLTRLGFERWKDSCTSFSVIRQVTTISIGRNENDEPRYQAFRQQFLSRRTNLQLASSADSLDPRLSELVCQLEAISGAPLPSTNDVMITLPILQEFPARVSAWSYGRDLRWLAYALLAMHYSRAVKVVQGVSCNAQCSLKDLQISECSRLGQRIAKDTKAATSLARLVSGDAAALHTISSCEDTLSNCTSASDFLLIAVRYVLEEHRRLGKSPTSRCLIEQFLGLQPHGKNSGWDILHFNATVQAWLYSLRILKQTADFVVRDGVTSTHVDGALQFRLQELSTKTSNLLTKMPSISELFVGPASVRKIMQILSPSDLQGQVDKMFATLHGRQIAESSTVSPVKPPGNRDQHDTTGADIHAGNKYRSRKRKNTTRNKTTPADFDAGKTARSSNSFALLGGSA